MSRNAQGTAAFTLTETVLAMAILGAAIVPILGMLSQGARVTRSTLDEVLATSFATDVLEQVELSGAADLPTSARLTTADGQLHDGTAIPGGRGAVFHLAPAPAGVALALTFTTPAPGLRKITLRAWRSDGGGPPLALELETLVEEPDAGAAGWEDESW